MKTRELQWATRPLAAITEAEEILVVMFLAGTSPSINT